MIKDQIKRLLRRAGWQVQHYAPSTSLDAQLNRLFEAHRVDCLLDVGANQGQYGARMRLAGYRGRIVSFEPLPDPWRLCAERARRDGRWDMAPRAAIGDRDSTTEMYVSANSVSSSLLAMCPTHQEAAPGSVYTGRVVVDVRRLDTLGIPFVRSVKRAFVKVDVQGYERHVLEGASGVLDRIIGAQLEMSLVSLYEGAATFDEMLGLMNHLGFQLFAVWPGFVDPATARTLQVDGVFFRES